MCIEIVAWPIKLIEIVFEQTFIGKYFIGVKNVVIKKVKKIIESVLSLQ